MTINEVVNSTSAHQVMFYDGEGMCAGIMFGDKIFCGCCGSVFEVDAVITMARDARELGEDVVAIRMFDTWVDVSDEIKGDGSDEGIILKETEE